MYIKTISVAKWAEGDGTQYILTHARAVLEQLKRIQQEGITIPAEGEGEHARAAYMVKVVLWETHDYAAWCSMFLGKVMPTTADFDVFNEWVRLQKGNQSVGTVPTTVLTWSGETLADFSKRAQQDGGVEADGMNGVEQLRALNPVLLREVNEGDILNTGTGLT